MSSVIPIELQINVLERLPVKTIVSFTAICKSWYSMIKNPDILKPHLKLPSSPNNNPEEEGHTLIMPRDLINDGENHCVVLSQDLFVARETFGFHFISNDQAMVNIGSCNGVICLSASDFSVYGKELFLFNPSIRKLRRLPFSLSEDRLENSGTKVRRFLGFGYDQITDDYKVVKLYRICKGIGSDSVVDEYQIYKFDVELEAEVYSLRSDSWRTVQANDHRLFGGGSVSLNNSIHWLSNDNDNAADLIVAYDFSAEVFREIILPIGCGYGYSYMLSYKGSLAILELEGEVYHVGMEESEDESEEEEDDEVPISLWIMKEYGVHESWSKEFTKVIHRSFDEPIQFTKNGKLIYKKQNTEMVAWDPESGQVVDLGFSDEDYIIVEDYIESLILI